MKIKEKSVNQVSLPEEYTYTRRYVATVETLMLKQRALLAKKGNGILKYIKKSAAFILSLVHSDRMYGNGSKLCQAGEVKNWC